MLLFILDNSFLLAIIFFLGFILIHQKNHRLGFFFDNVVLSACGGITMAFTLSSINGINERSLDLLFGLIVLGCSLKSLYHNSRKYLMIGYFLHAAWDLLHHGYFGLATKTPYWYPTFCMLYDLGVALWYYGGRR
ncbi:hypothetical protein DICPUDRAFT_37089 [Dictyostelium purpureum]|uniref:Uncharacterized protein n=1 Tax=Dictyostelium purpureum TaxID=5786 RepID=F0ZS57_DICPU|nr:uncharacterized protein DICPUDRAFT_37089 [Dictyostelium purpureum]EGC33209.1 hypothetical protein DICPUDRAFT_37089 [Dictyostelium purpureum]|eukprot:XP_003290249.1 hypothetical protein DICPUDRAFT_37089 [Dictyostelium purpureum]